MSLKIFTRSAIFDSGFINNAKIKRQGVSPRTVNKKIPGIKKFENGESFIMDKGTPSSPPEGEMINAPPPKIAPAPRNVIRPIRIFLKNVGFMMPKN
jgi:hypothetical protein